MYEGGQAAAQLGYAVAGIGNINPDDYDDVAFQRRGMMTERRERGRSNGFPGTETGLAIDPVWGETRK